jgi:hypothetical protein
MKGFINKTVTGLCLTVVLSPLTGCVCYRNAVDPCWPQRYNAMAHESVDHITNVQADKGHVLDQTVWNWMFEVDQKTNAPTDRLSPGGIEQLKYISRRLPIPDGQLYLQNAQDIPYVQGVAPEKLVSQRNDLNNRRIQAIHGFLATQSITHAASYHVEVHDFAPSGIPANVIAGTQSPAPPVPGAYPQLEGNFKGKLTNIISTGGGSGAGGAP